MRAGALNRRITIEYQPSGQDTYGQPNGTWTEFATVWAGIDTKQGKEILSAYRDVSERESVFEIRYLDGITEAMRISYGSKTYEVTSVIDVGERKTKMLLAGKVAL